MPTRSEARKREWEDPITRARRCAGVSRAAKQRYESQEERELASKRAKAAYRNNPELVEKNRQHLRKLNIARRGKPAGALGLSNSPEYRVLDAMIQRCHNPKTKYYANYGGRGIKVCDAWRGRGGFAKFYQYVGPKPTPKHTIERIDNDGNYAPGNVRWATRLEQMRNWRRNKMVTLNGRTQHVAAWARELGVNEQVLRYRLKAGWSLEHLCDPPRRKKAMH